jgi:hypothetical protein
MQTWEEAAKAATRGLANLGFFASPYDELQYWFKSYKETGIIDFKYMAIAALTAYPSELTIPEKIDQILLPTIAKKQHDYGHENIIWGGTDGVILRMHDKIARIENLQRREVSAHNESLADSWLDIAGYAVIGLMLENGTFNLSLAADLEN